MKQTEYLKLAELTKLPNNPRVIKDKQFETLVKSIQDNPNYFEARPIIVSNRTGQLIILAGNQRYEAAKHLKLEKVPVYIMEGLTDAKEKEIVIRDNVSNGEWDYDILANEWEADQLTEWGVDLPVFDENIIDVEEDEFNESESIETNIQYGDMFKVGNHYLLCGDATKKEDCEKIMQGVKSDMIFTDPPYDLDDSYSQNIFDAAKEDSHVFIMNSDKKLIDIINNGYSWFRKFFAVDFRLAHLTENNAPMTRVDLIAEFCKGKTKFNNLHDGFSTLIECAKIHNDNEKINFGHKQAKKIELPSTFIQHYSNENEIIVDFFGGSGSTMAACEQLKRNCFMMELEPKNCQIILDRMKKCYNLESSKLN